MTEQQICNCQARIKAALPGLPVSDGRDKVDELLNYCRTLREQRDSAWKEIQRLERSRGNTAAAHKLELYKAVQEASPKMEPHER